MMVSLPLVKRIISRASTLYERIGYDSPHNDDSDTSQSVRKRFERWQINAAINDAEKFSRRIRWDGLDERKARQILRTMEMCECPNSDWERTLEECLEVIATECAIQLEFLTKCETCETLDDFVRPICRAIADFARQHLLNNSGETYSLVTHTAWLDLTTGLESRLLAIFRPAVEANFQLFILSRQSSLTVHFRKLAGLSKSDLRMFLLHLSQDGMARFFEEYSFLARLLAVTVHEWRSATEEFITRAWKDRYRLLTLIGTISQPLPIMRVQGGISDFHHGSRSVLVVTLSNGQKVVYKPKDVRMERAFSDLLHWLNMSGLDPKLKPLKVMDGLGYGWVEHIDSTVCSNEDQAHLYFERCGMLLALCYILEGTDLHYENIIACGANPVIVDLETIFHPQYPEDETSGCDAQRIVSGLTLTVLTAAGLSDA